LPLSLTPRVPLAPVLSYLATPTAPSIYHSARLLGLIEVYLKVRRASWRVCHGVCRDQDAMGDRGWPTLARDRVGLDA